MNIPLKVDDARHEKYLAASVILHLFNFSAVQDLSGDYANRGQDTISEVENFYVRLRD